MKRFLFFYSIFISLAFIGTVFYYSSLFSKNSLANSISQFSKADVSSSQSAGKDSIDTKENSQEVAAPDQEQQDSQALVLGNDQEKSYEEQLEDIAELLDITQQKMAHIVEEYPNTRIALVDISNQDSIDEKSNESMESQNNQNTVVLNQESHQTHNTHSSTSSSPRETTYPKIFISEIEIAGVSDEKEEFIELYNPSDEQVKLDDWYLQRKTASGNSWQTFASKNIFEGEEILPKSYFLIAREGYYQNVADVVVDTSITDNNSFILKNPNGDISDKVGLGSSPEFSGSPAPNPLGGQSIGRKILTDNSLADTANNGNDFEIQLLTPKSNNITFIENTSEDNNENSDEDNNTSNNENSESNDSNQSDTTENNNTDQQTVDDPSQDNNESVGQESPKNIVINEIQIAGATILDEFIELYNPNNVDVDLAGYALKKKTSSGTESNLVSSSAFQGIIKANSYFVIAPQDASDGAKNYTGSYVPDLRYSGATFSIANNNTVLLYDTSGMVTDKVGFGSAGDFEASSAPNHDALQSIARKTTGSDTDSNFEDFTISETSTPGT